MRGKEAPCPRGRTGTADIAAGHEDLSPMQRHNFGRFSAPVNSDKLRIANHPGLTSMELAAPPEHCVPTMHVSHIQSRGAASMLPPGCSGGFSIAGGIPLVWNSVVLTQHTMVADEWGIMGGG